MALKDRWKKLKNRFTTATNPLLGGVSTLTNLKAAGEQIEAEEELASAIEKQNQLLDDIKAGRADADEEFQKLIEEYPVYQKDPALMQELRDRFTQAENEQRGALREYETTIGKAKGELTRAEEEARTGLDASLTRLRNLAKKDYLPGQMYAEEQIGETTASALANIKKLTGGRGGLSALTDIYKSEQEQKKQLGLQAAQTQLDLDLGLATAEKEAGLQMADIIQSGAVTRANMGAGLYSAFSDYATKKMASAQTLYGAERAENVLEYQSQTVPAQMAASYAQSKYFETNPYAYEANLLATERGMAYSDVMTAQNQIQQNNQMIANMITQLLSGGMTGNINIPGLGGTNTNVNQSSGQVVPYDYTPTTNFNLQNYFG